MYIQYTMDQLFLPMDLEEDIPQNHLVRVVNDMVERIDDSLFAAAYPGGGRHSYHPKMLTKVILYAYSQRLYSSRQIAKAVREHIPFMWLAARQQPDFRTLNRFRSERMKEVLEPLFTALLGLLVQGGYVKLDHYFVDGTKIEANANRYTFVWKKAVVKHKMKLQEKVKVLFSTIEHEEAQDEKTHEDRDLDELGEQASLSSDMPEEAVTRLEERLARKPKDKPLKKAVRILKKDYLPRMQRYEQQEATCGDRNSYSKTDPDATFMRMKEDHMKNGQLKPGYNVQVGTENQFIVGYSLHQRPTDTRCLIPHLKALQGKLKHLPKTIIADAGYGSEENYAWLEEEQHEALVKYNTYHTEQTKAWQTNPGKLENWTYEEEEDHWICSAGRMLNFVRESRSTTDTGYEVRLRTYRSNDCTGCPLKAGCTKAEGNREIRVSMEALRYRRQARDKLRSEEGRSLSARRMSEVESVFGQLKNNRGFRRFLLRGLEKTSLEVGWLSLAHNLLKRHTVDQNCKAAVQG